MTLTPAYGRDYRSRAEVLADWNAGKDFMVNTYGTPVTYINAEQVPDGTRVQFRYAQMRKTFSTQHMKGHTK